MNKRNDNNSTSFISSNLSSNSNFSSNSISSKQVHKLYDGSKSSDRFKYDMSLSDSSNNMSKSNSYSTLPLGQKESVHKSSSNESLSFDSKYSHDKSISL